jgi:hypothetical protein
VEGSGDSNHAYGEVTGVSGAVVVTLKVAGTDPKCGPHTMPDADTAIADLDDCPWCE